MSLKRFVSSTIILASISAGQVLAEVPVVESLPTVESADPASKSVVDRAIQQSRVQQSQTQSQQRVVDESASGQPASSTAFFSQ